ncbi:MAG: UDP-glucose 4-epimerase GalE [Alphaproteobacteria bacterium]
MTTHNPPILVTGGAGFIGSHICQALHGAGFTPVVFDNLCSGHAWAVQWGPLVQGDVRDVAALNAVFETYKPAAVVHCAALIAVGESVKNPADFYANNVTGSLNRLNTMHAHGCKHMVFSGTAAVYGNPASVPIPETAAHLPVNPYGNSKLAIEYALRDYAAAYGLTYATLRYFNAAGADAGGTIGSAYRTDTHIIPLLMRVSIGLQPHIKLFGTDYPTPDGSAIRDYIHVTDMADAHVRALQHLLKGGECLELNLGTNTGYSVRQVIETARAVTGQPIPAVEEPRRAGDPAQLIADASRARAVLGWTPQYSDLPTIIASAWRWRQILSAKQAQEAKTL